MMQIDKERFKVYTWKHWIMLHWIINPGLAINELVFGQRVPKVSLVDKTLDKPRSERSFTPCPHCETLHDSRTWSTQNGTAFKNWFGLYCPTCGNIIPCLTNVLSFVILVLSYPLRIWFIGRAKEKWLARQPQRFQNIDVEKVPDPFNKENWLWTGLGWGAVMFVLMGIVFPYFDGDEITGRSLLIGVLIWAVAGLLFGNTMKLMNSKHPSGLHHDG